MSPLLTGLAKLTPEEFGAVMAASKELVTAERERIIAVVREWMEWANLEEDGDNLIEHIRKGP